MISFCSWSLVTQTEPGLRGINGGPNGLDALSATVSKMNVATVPASVAVSVAVVEGSETKFPTSHACDSGRDLFDGQFQFSHTSLEITAPLQHIGPNHFDTRISKFREC
jgi:hypothetical protein